MPFLANTQDQWQWVHPQPCGNAVLSMQAVDSLHVWMVGTGGTVVFTKDGGENWELYQSDTNDMMMSVSFVDKLNGWISALGGVVYRTSDGGYTWNRSTINESNPGDVCFTDSLNGWIGCRFDNTIFQTLDGGLTWYPSTITGLYTSTFKISFSDSLNGWIAGTGSMVAHTTDGGESWTLHLANFPSTTWMRRLCTPDNSTVLALTDYDGKIHYSNDGGLNWGTRTPTSFNWKNFYFSDKNNGWAVGFNSCPAPVYNEGRIERTTDGGATFGNKYSITGRSLLNNVTASDSMHAWVTGYGGKILATKDGGLTWQEQSLSLSDPPRVTKIFALKEQHAAWAVGWGGFILKTTDDGLSWENLSIDPTVNLTGVHFFDTQNGIITGRDSQIFNTSDGGINWEEVTAPVNKTYRDLFFQTPTHGWITANNRILETLDGGKTWHVNVIIPANIALYSIVFSDSLHGWAIGDDDWSQSLMAYTKDGGATWETIDFDIPELRSVSFTDSLHGWICGSHGVILKTTDGGITWEKSTYNQYVDFTSIHFFDSDHGWVVGDGSILHSYSGIALYTDDSGVTWKHKDAGVGMALTSVFFSDHDFGYATGSEGTILRWGDTYVGINDQKPLASNLKLNNFPNPFSKTTTISYFLDKTSDVSIEIYRLTGEQILSRQLIRQPIGKHECLFDATELPSGMYLYRIRANEKVETNKMVVIH